ncbi:MAG: hypothetical protein ACJAY5_000359 [Actinomycetes bacterium]|jgi:hypothetical protein
MGMQLERLKCTEILADSHFLLFLPCNRVINVTYSPNRSSGAGRKRLDWVAEVTSYMVVSVL